jgi:aminomethyltransferase
MPEKKDLKVTPLHDAHLKAGARMVPFSGWEMPVQYQGIIEEHEAVRNTAGLFDISHMGEVRVSGPRAESWLNTVLSNDVRQINPGESQYTLILNDQGGVIDDLLIYRLTELEYLLVINAARIKEDLQWLESHLTDNVKLEDISSQTAAIALQGPLTAEILQRVFPEADPLPAPGKIKPWNIHPDAEIYIGRSGYTGEDGVELFFPNEVAEEIWDQIIERGKSLGCQPAGLGARDTLRLEASLPLNGNDLGTDFTPYESGVGFAVAFDKPEKFLGRERLRQQKANGIPRKLIPFTMDKPGAPPRAGYGVWIGEDKVGTVTSGGHSPTLKCGIGFARIESSVAKSGTSVEIDIRGKRQPATLQKRPLYKKDHKA